MIPLDRTGKKQTVLSGGIIMPQKEKYPLECNIAICNAILHRTLTIRGAARQYHIDYTTIRDCFLAYQSDGAYGLVPGKHYKSYSSERKWSAVQDYLSGKGTATQICTKYRIKSVNRLRMPSRTPEEALRDRVADLEHQNRMLRIERDVLKKCRNSRGGMLWLYAPDT